MMNKINEIKIPKLIKTILKLLAIIFIFLGCRSFLFDIDYETEFDQVFTSPKETNTIIVRYDYLGRPDVFLNDKYGEKIFKNSTAGIMTGPQFEVEWVNEYKLKLYSDYFNVEYIVVIPRD